MGRARLAGPEPFRRVTAAARPEDRAVSPPSLQVAASSDDFRPATGRRGIPWNLFANARFGAIGRIDSPRSSSSDGHRVNPGRSSISPAGAPTGTRPGCGGGGRSRRPALIRFGGGRSHRTVSLRRRCATLRSRGSVSGRAGARRGHPPPPARPERRPRHGPIALTGQPGGGNGGGAGHLSSPSLRVGVYIDGYNLCYGARGLRCTPETSEISSSPRSVSLAGFSASYSRGGPLGRRSSRTSRAPLRPGGWTTSRCRHC